MIGLLEFKKALGGLNEDLSEENLPEAKQKALIDRFFMIIEYKGTKEETDKFLDSYTHVQRMKAVFNLYAENALFQKTIEEKLKLDENEKNNCDECSESNQARAF